VKKEFAETVLPEKRCKMEKYVENFLQGIDINSTKRAC
jgi:hypothetical protein